MVRQLCLGCIAAVICSSFFSINADAVAVMDLINLTPELLDSDEGNISVGLKFEVTANGNKIHEFDSISLNYELKGEWASEDDTNTDPIEAKVNLAFDSLSDLTEGDIFFMGQLDAGFLADDRFEDLEFAGGLVLGVVYENSITFKLHLLGHYDWVYSYESDQRENLGGSDKDDFYRRELESLAVLRFRRLTSTPFINNLKLSGNYRHFCQTGMDTTMDEFDQDSFEYVKVDLAYEWWANRMFGLVQEVFVAYSYGRLPTQTEDQAVWTAGVVLYGSK